MTNRKGIVYITINLLNNKIYIGQTVANKPGYLGSGSKFSKILKEVGRENFKREILRDNVDPEDLCFWEQFYIKLYDSANPDIGYNIKVKGSNRGFIHSKESIQKIKERSNKEDNRTRIREIQKLAVKKRIGSHHSDMAKRNMALIKFGENRIIEIYNKDDKTLYNTCFTSKEAESLTGVKRSAISNNLLGISKSSRKFMFKYKILH
jgi:group I intron endonuclease